MGATNFDLVIRGNRSAQDAYTSAVDDALHEYGHDSYNGTISTTEGVNVVNVRPMAEADAARLAGERLDNLQKWGPCEAIPLLAETPPTYGPMVQHQIAVEVPAEVWRDRAKMRALIAKQLKVKTTEVTDWHAVYDTEARSSVQVQAKVTAKATEGKTETRYFVLTGQNQAMPRWENGHPTQAAARAAVTGASVSSWSGNFDVEYEIIAITRRAGGEPLVKATLAARKIAARLRVNTRPMLTAAKVGTTQDGWLFFGWAAT